MENTPKKIRLAIVDHDEKEQEAFTTYLKSKGYEVFNYLKKEMLLNENRSIIWDIVLISQEQHNKSNQHFIETLNSKYPSMPIIILSLDNSEEATKFILGRVGCDFILKPIQLHQLQISIEKALFNSQYNTSTLKSTISPDLEENVLDNSIEIIGSSPKFMEVLNISNKVASSDASIFISGESGSGKEVIARYIHKSGNRKNAPFVAINCSAIPENLLESELFGHVKGAFTNAIEKKIGLFEEAENGTLFLDEIGDLTLSLQAKLLRVLQEKKIKRIGENIFRQINVRIISATHKNLAIEVKENRFREDLYFRLNVVPIYIPSLNERAVDILPLAEYFLRKYCRVNNFSNKMFSENVKSYLLVHHWRGNVRELENSVERAVVMCKTDVLELNDFLLDSSQELIEIDVEPKENKTKIALAHAEVFKVGMQKSLLPLEKVVQEYIEFAINRNGGAKDRTAKEIGIDRKTLYRKMKRFENTLMLSKLT